MREDLENTLSEINQMEKDEYYNDIYFWNIKLMNIYIKTKNYHKVMIIIPCVVQYILADYEFYTQ